MTTTFEVKATIPYALRNEGCAVDEMDMRRKAANYIEYLEKQNGQLAMLLDDARAHLPPECAVLRNQIEAVLRPKTGA